MTSNAARSGRAAPRLSHAVGAARAWFAARLLPQSCVLCASPSGARLLCAPCEHDLPRMPAACPVCAMPSRSSRICGACMRDRPSFDRTIAATPYGFPVDRLVQALKFRAHLPLAAVFGPMLARAAGPGTGVDLVVPMPLAPARIRERGFNQSAEIAKHCAEALAIDLALEGARRVRETAPQSTLAHRDRLRNVKDAFAADAAVMGRRVAVVDDVMTTGASLEALARALKRGGALHVENWVIARAFGTELDDAHA